MLSGMSSKKLGRVFFFQVLLAGAVLFAQKADTVPIRFQVTDPTRAFVPHAKVVIIPVPDTGPSLETDDKGQIGIQLSPGEYVVVVESPGFKKSVTHINVPETKEPQTVSVMLQIAAGGSVEVQSPPARDSLTVSISEYQLSTVLPSADLKAMPHVTVTIHNAHTNADETYSGIRLADILKKFSVPLGSDLRGKALANYIIGTGSDGYKAVLALAEVDPSFHPGEVLVADTMDGKPLDAHNGPLKLVVTEDKRPARSVRNLVSIELKSAQ